MFTKAKIAERISFRNNIHEQPEWMINRNAIDDILSFILWLTIALIVYLLSFPTYSPQLALPYIIFILYYTRLYWRLITVPMWAEDTLKILKKYVSPYSKKNQLNIFEDKELPDIIVLIAAYKAEGSISSVLKALQLQNYPENKYKVIVITQQAENDEKWKRYDSVKENILKLLKSREIDQSHSILDIELLKELIHSNLKGTDSEDEIKTELSSLIAAYLLFGKSYRFIVEQAACSLIDNFFYQYQLHGFISSLSLFHSVGISINSNEEKFIKYVVKTCFKKSDRITRDFSKILGLINNQTIFIDPLKTSKLAISLKNENIFVNLASLYLRKKIRRQLKNYISTVEKQLDEIQSNLLDLPYLSDRMKAIYNRINRTCPEVVDESLLSTNHSQFCHICRKKIGGGKPVSLNTGYFHILENGSCQISDSTHFLVIDADSLLHSSTLRTIANEISKDTDKNIIRQIAPLSTSNFFGNDSYGKLISCLDTIGSMGKWARNIRTQKRPDLPAGSGVAIPATFIKYLEELKEVPWETNTITEDARMIITDYGLIDGANSKTKFVPIYLLEAVPEGRNIIQTYKNYFAQRMRWASGGPTEIIELLKAFHNKKPFTSSNDGNGNFISYIPNFITKMKVRYRHIRLLMYWISDHFWWGFGFGLAPIVWLLFSYYFITPPFLKLFGLMLLLGTPTMVIFNVFKKFSCFVPGGLDYLTLLKLYVATIFMAWFQTLPIMYTQLLFLFRKKNKFHEWTATAKPQF